MKYNAIEMHSQIRQRVKKKLNAEKSDVYLQIWNWARISPVNFLKLKPEPEPDPKSPARLTTLNQLYCWGMR